LGTHPVNAMTAIVVQLNRFVEIDVVLHKCRNMVHSSLLRIGH
jgi:hypothetical protein